MLTLTMVLAMSATVFAAHEGEPAEKKDSYTISIHGKTTGHQYGAYQIFAGELAKVNNELVLSNITWGSAINSSEEDSLIKDLKAITELGIKTEANSAREMAEAIANHSNDQDIAKKVADVFGKYAKNASAMSQDDSSTEYSITVDTAGYYFIKDEKKISANATATDFILRVVGNTEAHTKDDVVKLDKKIISGNQNVESNIAGINDNVTYVLSSNVPDYTNYKKNYYFVINDTLSEGLTFNNDLVVTVGGKELVKDTDYFVYQGKDDIRVEGNAKVTEQKFKIAFANFIDKKYKVGDEILVIYSAKVNDKAVIDGNGNPNTANLEYSNDPNFDYDGDPGQENKPGLPDKTKYPVIGETPEVVVVTFTTQIHILKTQNDKTTPLKDAEFTLEGIAKETVLKTKDQFVEDLNGSWYQLKEKDEKGNPKYTDQAPTKEPTMQEIGGLSDKGYVKAEDDYDEADAVTVNNVKYRPIKEGESSNHAYILIEPNDSEYESTTIKFRKEESVAENTVTEKVVKMVVRSDGDGNIIFPRLGEGEFTITETKTPAGFNTAIPVKVVITGTVNGTGNDATCTWNYVGSSQGVEVVQNSEGKFEYYVNIVNKSGSLLPETGGIGTTIFYIIGGILVVGAAILLVTKKRMSKEV